MATETGVTVAAPAALRRRAAARLVDGLWLVPAGWFAWGASSMLVDLDWLRRAAAVALFVCALQLVLEPLLLTLFGATPGKALLGIEVRQADGRRPTLAVAFGRTLKIVAGVFGLWFAPLAAVTLPLAAWRMALQRPGVPLPWDRHGAGLQVVAVARVRRGRAAAALVAALLPGFALPLASVVVGLLVMSSRGLDASQDVSRAVAGRWLWLHRLSGAMLPLDARWRTLHDHLRPGVAELSAVFAWGSGEHERIRVDTRRAAAAWRAPCDWQRTAMEEEGFLFLDEQRRRDGDTERCRLSGGRPGPRGVVHVRIDGARGADLDYTVVQTYEPAREGAREAVLALGRRLLAEYGRHDMADGQLRSYYWRNDVTGERARIPGEWELYERILNVNGAVSFTFQRLAGPWPHTVVEDAAVMVLPLPAFAHEPDLHAYVAQGLVDIVKGTRTTRRPIAPREWVSDVEAERGLYHAWSREDVALTWAVLWRSPDGAAPIGTPDRHPLFAEIVKTMRH